MHILSRRLYNGGFDHLRRRTSSLILGVARVDAQPPQARFMCATSNIHLPQIKQSTEDGHAHGIHSFLNSQRSSSTLSSERIMPAHQEWVQNNDQYAATFGEKGALPLHPGKKLAIVTCMDARINVYAELGINEGDSHIIRNAGGSARDALRSIIISQRLLGTREIAVFHHTDCGMLTFTTPQLRKIVKDSDPSDPSLNVVDEIDFLEFPELVQSVKDDVEFLKTNSLVLKGTVVTGWTYDVTTGKIRQVV